MAMCIFEGLATYTRFEFYQKQKTQAACHRRPSEAAMLVTRPPGADGTNGIPPLPQVTRETKRVSAGEAPWDFGTTARSAKRNRRSRMQLRASARPARKSGQLEHNDRCSPPNQAPTTGKRGVPMNLRLRSHPSKPLKCPEPSLRLRGAALAPSPGGGDGHTCWLLGSAGKAAGSTPLPGCIGAE